MQAQVPAEAVDSLDEKTTEVYWIEKIKLQPEVALNYFNLGVVLQKAGKYEEAIKNYDKAIELKSPLAPVAVFYKARAFESLGNTGTAKLLISSIEIEKVPPNFKTKVLEYKNKLYADSAIEASQIEYKKEDLNIDNDYKDEKTFSAYLEVMRGTNSNPDIYADTQSSSISSDVQSQYRAGIDYLASVSDSHDFKLSYAFAATQFDKSTGSNYASHDVALPVSIYFESSRLKLTPMYTLDTYAGSNFSESKGADLGYTLKLNNNYLNFNVQALKIDNKTTTYSYLSGNSTKLSVSYDQRFSSSRFTTTLYRADYKYQDTSTLGSSYTSYVGWLSYMYYFNDFDFSLGGGLDSKQYVKASSVTTTRRDLKYSLNLQLGYSFATYFRIFIDGSYIKNTSNFNTTTDDRNYQQNAISAGLSWTF